MDHAAVTPHAVHFSSNSKKKGCKKFVCPCECESLKHGVLWCCCRRRCRFCCCCCSSLTTTSSYILRWRGFSSSFRRRNLSTPHSVRQ